MAFVMFICWLADIKSANRHNNKRQTNTFRFYYHSRIHYTETANRKRQNEEKFAQLQSKHAYLLDLYSFNARKLWHSNDK